MTPRPGTITVLIATYNRAALLLECLQALAVQDFEPDDEVIIVDNASTDGTKAAVARAATWFPVALRYLYEPHAGKSHALSAGLLYAIGDVIAFTDDDVLVARDWLDSMRRALQDPSVALVAGRVEPRWDIPPPRWLRFEHAKGYSALASPLALLDYGIETSVLDARTALGANMAVRRTALSTIGGFPTTLGKLRHTLLSGEDRYVCERLRDAGHRCMYVPSIVVRHWVPRERLRLLYYLRWFFWSGITNSVLDAAEPAAGRELLGVPSYVLRRVPASAAATLAAAARGSLTTAVERMMNVAFTLGYLAHRWRVSAAAPPIPRHAGAQQT